MTSYRKIILVALIAVFTAFFIYLKNGEVEDNGKVYSSRANLCMHFAQSFLRTVQETESKLTEEQWEMAIDIETDFYNMCLLDLNEESLSNYKTAALEKYKQLPE